MYKYCTWVWFSASRQLQLVLIEDLGATVTFSAFAALSPRGPEQLLYKVMPALMELWGGKAFLSSVKPNHCMLELNILQVKCCYPL